MAAHLDAEGRLVVTGDWNGGERHFNIRPRQQLRLVSVEHADGYRLEPVVG